MRITTEGLKRIIREEIMKEAGWFSKINPFSEENQDKSERAAREKRWADRDAKNKAKEERSYQQKKAEFLAKKPDGTKSDFLSFIEDDFDKKTTFNSSDPDESRWWQGHYPLEFYKKRASEDADLKESARVGLNRLRRIIREEIEREQVTEIFGWSRKEKEERERKEQAVDAARDADFDRESAKNEEDWADHKSHRENEEIKKIQDLKRGIEEKFIQILGKGASKDDSGNPRMNEFTEGELAILDKIFKIGSGMRYPRNVNPLGITTTTFVPYVNFYMDLWRDGVQEPERSKEARIKYSGHASELRGKQKVSTHPRGSHKVRRQSYRPNYGR